MVYAESISSKNKKNIDEDNISIIIKFKNGSIANILYHSNGSQKLSKERIEIHSQNKSFILDDFKKVISYSNGIKKMSSNSKGHKEEVNIFLESVMKEQVLFP